MHLPKIKIWTRNNEIGNVWTKTNVVYAFFSANISQRDVESRSRGKSWVFGLWQRLANKPSWKVCTEMRMWYGRIIPQLEIFKCGYFLFGSQKTKSQGFHEFLVEKKGWVAVSIQFICSISAERSSWLGLISVCFYLPFEFRSQLFFLTFWLVYLPILQVYLFWRICSLFSCSFWGSPYFSSCQEALESLFPPNLSCRDQLVHKNPI